ncbi:MAG: hypothetical protein ACM3JI_02955, partial [Anaerolineae bacterium]
PPVYTISDLEHRLEKLRFVGSGGEGCIYEVKENLTSSKMALKIASNNWRISKDNEQVAKTVSFILKRGISPHLTQIHGLLSVKCPVFAKLAGNSGAGFFDGQHEGGGNKTFLRRVFLMEILQGNLQELYDTKKGLSKEVVVAFSVQILSIQLILEEQGIRHLESGKWRNILYKTLEPEDLCQGKAMIDFDFWRYVFGKHELFLPRQKYLIKLADYDPWIAVSKDDNLNPEKSLENCLTRENVTLKELQDWFKKPEDPNAKVLEVYDSSKPLPEE